MFFSPLVSRASSYSPFVLGAPNWQPAGMCGTGSDHAEQFEPTSSGYTLTLDVPGLRKEHLSIEVEGRVLRIRTLDDAPRRYHAAYRLPQTLNAEATTAKLEDGVLTVAIVNAAPAVTAKSITIQ